jgi:hypothetical protein
MKQLAKLETWQYKINQEEIPVENIQKRSVLLFDFFCLENTNKDKNQKSVEKMSLRFKIITKKSESITFGTFLK